MFLSYGVTTTHLKSPGSHTLQAPVASSTAATHLKWSNFGLQSRNQRKLMQTLVINILYEQSSKCVNNKRSSCWQMKKPSGVSREANFTSHFYCQSSAGKERDYSQMLVKRKNTRNSVWHVLQGSWLGFISASKSQESSHPTRGHDCTPNLVFNKCCHSETTTHVGKLEPLKLKCSYNSMLCVRVLQ